MESGAHRRVGSDTIQRVKRKVAHKLLEWRDADGAVRRLIIDTANLLISRPARARRSSRNQHFTLAANSDGKLRTVGTDAAYRSPLWRRATPFGKPPMRATSRPVGAADTLVTMSGDYPHDSTCNGQHNAIEPSKPGEASFGPHPDRC